MLATSIPISGNTDLASTFYWRQIEFYLGVGIWCGDLREVFPEPLNFIWLMFLGKPNDILVALDIARIPHLDEKSEVSR